MLNRLVITLLLALPATASAEPHFRIVRGAPIADESVPFMASLVQSGYSAYDGHFCGGSVIAPDVVLTAAHCVEGETARSISVVTGRSRLSDDGTGTRSRVDALAVDPRYDNDGNDAALVHLADAVAVPSIGLSDDPAPLGLAAVAGWGLTTSSRPRDISDDLRAVQIPVVANRDCRRRYGRDFSAATMLCAGGDGRDSCNGDSGGPLVGADGREIGIVSFGGRRCGARRVPAVYTRVAAELPWITGVLSRWS